MSGINWATVRANNEHAPADTTVPAYTPDLEEQLRTLATHLINDHHYDPATITPLSGKPSQESWAILNRLHTSAQMLNARVILNTTGKGPS